MPVTTGQKGPDISDANSFRELGALSEIDLNPEITQRQLAQRLGIALGLTNLLLRGLLHRGYIRVTKSSWKRRLYTLTPDGFSRKLRLLVDYIQRFLDHYSQVRQSLRDELDGLSLNEESRIALYCTGEFAELIYLGLKEIGIEEIYVFSDNVSGTRKFLGMDVLDVNDLIPESYDRVLITNLDSTDPMLGAFLLRNQKADNLVTFFDKNKLQGGS